MLEVHKIQSRHTFASLNQMDDSKSSLLMTSIRTKLMFAVERPGESVSRGVSVAQRVRKSELLKTDECCREKVLSGEDVHVKLLMADEVIGPSRRETELVPKAAAKS